MKKVLYMLAAIFFSWFQTGSADAVNPQLTAGENHTVGLKADGTVVAVGDNREGQCNVSGWTGIVQVAACEAHTVGLKADGTLVAAGLNREGNWRKLGTATNKSWL